MKKYETIHKTKDFLIINKGSGVSTHPSPGDNAPNLVDLLRNDYQTLFPIIRLDKGTSGILIMGLTTKFVRKCRIKKKVYQAIVFGKTKNSETINKPLTKKEFKTGRKITQEAISHYKAIEISDQASLIEITIETGRHHQIRKHLRSIEHPIVGDFRHGYKDKNLEFQDKLEKQTRLALHSHKLIFEFQEKEFSFESAIPKELQEYWSFLK